MMGEPLTVKPSPCSSCPYRKNVPSGVWAAAEYDGLRDFDGESYEQAVTPNGLHLFMCHQADKKLCSGWIGHRRHPGDLLAVRMGIVKGEISREVLSYTTDVPLFASGAEAAEHGKRDIEHPSGKAQEQVSKITRVRAKRGEPVDFS